jgi:RNA polymerase sigma-70 factor, ECF subfamily
MPSDAELMDAVRSGDEAAFEALLARYWAPLVAYARRLVVHEYRAEDIAQETWIRLWERRAAWTPTGTVRGYLYRITRNLALNDLEKTRTERRWVEEEGRREFRHVPSPDEVIEGDRLRAVVEAAIAALPERRREVFVLARYHGHSYAEIAQVMGISRQTVANQMSAALDQLRAELHAEVDRES